MERKPLMYLKLGIAFLFVNINIGTVDILPEFVVLLFLYASIQSHAQQTETERKVKPLFLVLAADYFFALDSGF